MIGSKKKPKTTKGAAKVPVRKPTPKEADESASTVEKKKRGRPVGSVSGDKGPLGAAGVRVKRKTPDDIRDTRAAIARYRDDINKLVAREKTEHPGAIVRACPDLFVGESREPIPAAFFATTLMTAMAPVYGGLDVMSAFPSPEHFEKLGEMWSECSRHFDFGRWAVLAIALISTLGTVGGAVVVRLKVGSDTETGNRPKDAAGVGNVEGS